MWVMALQRTTPTRVASTMTVNPIAAALLASPLVGEPITPNLIVGLLPVFAGIWLATTKPWVETGRLPTGSAVA
jgi:drug/metabolite transporter (DMT)-like permease